MVTTIKTTSTVHRRADSAETAQSKASVDPLVLRAELEATRTNFHAFLSGLSAERWHQKSPSSAWTMAEVVVHLTWALEQLPQEIASARRGQGMFNSPKSFDWLADKLSYWIIRWMARKATPEVIGRRYDAAMTAVLRTLDEVKESDWALGASFYGHGFYSIADLFQTPAEHFTEHTGEV